MSDDSGKQRGRIEDAGWKIGLLMFCLSVVANYGFGQALYLPRYQEPRPFVFQLSQASVGAYAEGTFDQSSFQNSGSSVSHEHIFVGPAAGFAVNGSVYHPNFLIYTLNVDGAYGWTHDAFHSSGFKSAPRDETEYLGTFGFSVDLLSGKPYHATAFVNHDHTLRDNDFFTRVTVDSWRYGARVGWRLGKWDLSMDYYHRDEESSSVFPVSPQNPAPFNQNTVSHDDVLAFIARNERERGGTSLNYSWDQYARTDAGRLGVGNDQSVSLGDNERFGQLDRCRLNTTASYFRRDATSEASDEFLADATLNVEHLPKLNSFYNFDYDRFGLADFHSDSFSGQAGLQHELYESLYSTLLVHGSDFSTSASDSSTDTLRLGAGFSEVYTKHLSEEHRLRISNSLLVDYTDQESDVSQLITIRDEHHTFSEGGGIGDSFTLNLPNVVESSITVTDDRDTQPAFILNFDYRVIQNGSRTVIERITGSRIGTNSVVHVSYRAAGTPSGTYETITEGAEIRLELWKNLVGIYGRINLSLNNAPANLRVQEVTSYTFGSDLTWRWFRTGAEYIIYDSTQSEYRSARFFQSVSWHPDAESTLGMDFTEAWIDYINAHRQEENFQAITRYHRALTHRMGLDMDAGVSYRKGNGVDQVLATIRPSIKYIIGKLTLDAGYDYEYELFLNSEERQKHMFFLRLKRFF
jgi:hypothetical protein